MHRSFLHTSRSLWTAAVLLAGVTASADAQSVTREACTAGDVTVCAQVTLNATTSGVNTDLTFDVRNLGVFGNLTQAGQPSILWSLVFATGRDPFDPMDVTEQLVTPTSTTAIDASPWTFVDVGDLWQLIYVDAAFATKGIGSSVPFTGQIDVGGAAWSQIGTTGPNAISFSVTIPYLFSSNDLDGFQLFGLEATTFAVDGSSATLDLNGSCGELDPCGTVPATSVPEPASAALLGLGTVLLGTRARRRQQRTRRTA